MAMMVASAPGGSMVGVGLMAMLPNVTYRRADGDTPPPSTTGTATASVSGEGLEIEIGAFAA